MKNLIRKTTILSNLKDIERAEKNAVNFIKGFFKENFSDIKILRSTKEEDFIFSKVTMADDKEHFLKSKTDIKKIDYKITVSVFLVDLEEGPKRLLKQPDGQLIYLNIMNRYFIRQKKSPIGLRILCFLVLILDN